MKPRDFLQKLDDAEIVSAIQAAERKTSGEIRVFVSSRKVLRTGVEKHAGILFEKLGMTATQDRNAVLLYFAPYSQQYAIVGDTGIHEKCGEAVWHEVASTMRVRLQSGRFTEAAVEAIRTIGEVLARYFPRSPEDRDELPNKVERD
jgi:uncharacterized membrane protein